jgi:hypothetical protein
MQDALTPLPVPLDHPLVKALRKNARAALRHYVESKRTRDGIAWEVEPGSLRLTPLWRWRATLVAPRGRQVCVSYAGRNWRTRTS